MQALRLRVFFGLYFPKIDFLPIKKLYFPFLYLSSQFVIWLGHKPTLGLKISGSLGNRGARVKRGTNAVSIDAPLLICELYSQSQKNQRQNILFWCMARAQPIHTTHNTHTWGKVQLCKVMSDLYIRILTLVAWETSNDRFTIPELVFSIASKRPMTHYLRIT